MTVTAVIKFPQLSSMKPLTINNLSSRFKGSSSLPLNLLTIETFTLISLSIFLFLFYCAQQQFSRQLQSLLAGTQVSMDDDI